MIQNAVSLVSFAQNTVQGPRLLDHGALLRAPGSCALGGFIGIGWKGTRIFLLGRYACSPPHGPRTPAHGPLLQRRETRLTDGFPVTRFMLFKQAVAHQKRDTARANLDRRDHDNTLGAALAEASCKDSRLFPPADLDHLRTEQTKRAGRYDCAPTLGWQFRDRTGRSSTLLEPAIQSRISMKPGSERTRSAQAATAP